MTDLLYVKQSFLRGLGSLGNLGGKVLSNSSRTPEIADKKAIASDWQVVGADLKGATQKYVKSAQQ